MLVSDDLWGAGEKRDSICPVAITGKAETVLVVRGQDCIPTRNFLIHLRIRLFRSMLFHSLKGSRHTPRSVCREITAQGLAAQRV